MERYPDTQAQRRITERHGDPYDHAASNDAPMPPAEAIDTVVWAHYAHFRPDLLPDHGTPDEQDIADALTLLGPAREVLEYQEMQLIDMARFHGWTWSRVGALLGIGDRRKAQQRYRRLRERTPGYMPVHVEHGEGDDVDAVEAPATGRARGRGRGREEERATFVIDVAACTDPEVATTTAVSLFEGYTQQPGSEFWDSLSRRLLSCYLMAAALDDGGVDTLLTWVTHPDDRRPVELLRTSAVPQWADDCEQVLSYNEKVRASVLHNVQAALQWSNPRSVTGKDQHQEQ